MSAETDAIEPAVAQRIVEERYGQTIWLPDQASTFAGAHDWLFYFIYWVSVAAFALVMAAMIYFVIRYRRRHPDQRAVSRTSHSTTLEVTWSIIPTVIFVFIFWYGFKSYMDKANPPDYAYGPINVRAFTWGWQFTYPNGVQTDALYVPKDRPVRLILNSTDVIHSLFIPDFRVKKDVVPDRLNSMWFTATQLGSFQLVCAEYCGRDHAEMRTAVHVLEAQEFQVWLAAELERSQNLPPFQLGEQLYTSLGCAACHSLDGSSIRGGGPSFLNIFRYERQFTDGTSMIADEDYLRRSIIEPGAEIVAGYQNIMPSYAGQITTRQLDGLVAFIMAQSDRLTDAEREAMMVLPGQNGEAEDGEQTEEGDDSPAEEENES